MLNFYIFDIIEQFEVVSLSSIFNVNTLYVIFNIIILFFFLFIFSILISAKKNNIFYYFSYFLFLQLKINVKDKFKNNYFNIVYVYFLYILFFYVFFQNIVGMIPDTFTITSYIILPANITFTFFIASVILAIKQTKLKFIKGFLPSGVPIFVGPFLFLIEFISYFIRLFSLSIRLFINILAGHMLLKIFSTIILLSFFFIYEIFFLQLIINIIVFSFIFLEYAACISQAIVLISLISIYLDHSLNFIH